MTTVEPDWLVRPGLVAIGSITEIDGKIKAAGKSTLMLHMVHAVLSGQPFLGQPTRRTRVVYERMAETPVDLVVSRFSSARTNRGGLRPKPPSAVPQPKRCAAPPSKPHWMPRPAN